MHRASDEVEHAAHLDAIEAAAAALELEDRTVSAARDLFLTSVPETERSRRATAAASLYAAGLVTGDQRSQGAVADAFGVSRLSVQQGWKPLVEAAGFTAPDW